MKINIWIKKEELFNGVITEYHTQNEPNNGYDPSKYINVTLTTDEFAILEDTANVDPMGPAINEEDMTRLETRIYKESQNVTGGEFQAWYHNLTKLEIETYKLIYGN